jgi:hypothetical protein
MYITIALILAEKFIYDIISRDFIHKMLNEQININIDPGAIEVNAKKGLKEIESKVKEINGIRLSVNAFVPDNQIRFIDSRAAFNHIDITL